MVVGKKIVLSNQEKMILIAVSISGFMTNLDFSIVNISLPTISEYFGIDIGIAAWVVLIYALILSSFLLALGRLGDLVGFRKIFITGLVLFIAASFLCGVSTSIEELLLFRAIQAVGGGLISAVDFAMISSFLPEEVKGKGLGILTIFAALGISIGPVLGGFLTEFLGWQSIFLVNIPIAIVCVAISIKAIPKTEPTGPLEKLNLTGSALLFFSLLLFLFAINKGQEIGWTSLLIIGAFICSVILILLFKRQEGRAEFPLIDPRLASNKNVIYSNLAGLFLCAAFAGAFVLLPYYFEFVKVLSIEIVGFILISTSIAMMIAAPIAGSISDRLGARRPCIIGACLLTLSFMMCATFNVDTTLTFAIIALTIMGVGIGLFKPPSSNLIFHHSPKEAEGVTSALISTMRGVGRSVGDAALATTFSGVVASVPVMTMIHSTGLTPSDLVPGFSVAFIVGAGLCLIGLAFAILAKDKQMFEPDSISSDE